MPARLGARSQGERFYIVDEGEYAVTVGERPFHAPQVQRYTPRAEVGGANPCFGELALLYSKPRVANVVALTDGVLWALDRRSFRALLRRPPEAVLVRQLQAVPSLRLLPASRLCRLASLAVRVSFDAGERIMRQSEVQYGLYIVTEGRALLTMRESYDTPPKLLCEVLPGQLFGESSLLDDGPQTETAIAANDERGRPLRCLLLPRHAFDEVLTASRDVIAADAIWRLHGAVARTLRVARAPGLLDATPEAFVMQGSPASASANACAPCCYVLAARRGPPYVSEGATVAAGEYTLRLIRKADEVGSHEWRMGLEAGSSVHGGGNGGGGHGGGGGGGGGGGASKGARERRERRQHEACARDELALAAHLLGRSPFVPLPLVTFEDASHIYLVYATRVATTLRAVLDAEPGGRLGLASARFCSASVALAIDHLHREMPALGGLMARDVSPRALAINADGYLQLLDLRCVRPCAAHTRALGVEFVGLADYQPPEHILGASESSMGFAADAWALGALTYELITGGSPWRAPTPGGTHAETEHALFARILSHEPGKLAFPKGAPIGAELRAYLNALLDPRPSHRLGSGGRPGGGLAELRAHAWFGAHQVGGAPLAGGALEALDWAELATGRMESPLKAHGGQAVQDALAAGYAEGKEPAGRDRLWTPHTGSRALREASLAVRTNAATSGQHRLSVAVNKRPAGQQQQQQQQQQAVAGLWADDGRNSRARGGSSRQSTSNSQQRAAASRVQAVPAHEGEEATGSEPALARRAPPSRQSAPEARKSIVARTSAALVRTLVALGGGAASGVMNPANVLAAPQAATLTVHERVTALLTDLIERTTTGTTTGTAGTTGTAKGGGLLTALESASAELEEAAAVLTEDGVSDASTTLKAAAVMLVPAEPSAGSNERAGVWSTGQDENPVSALLGMMSNFTQRLGDFTGRVLFSTSGDSRQGTPKPPAHTPVHSATSSPSALMTILEDEPEGGGEGGGDGGSANGPNGSPVLGSVQEMVVNLTSRLGMDISPFPTRSSMDDSGAKLPRPSALPRPNNLPRSRPVSPMLMIEESPGQHADGGGASAGNESMHSPEQGPAAESGASPGLEEEEEEEEDGMLDHPIAARGMRAAGRSSPKIMTWADEPQGKNSSKLAAQQPLLDTPKKDEQPSQESKTDPQPSKAGTRAEATVGSGSSSARMVASNGKRLTDEIARRQPLTRR